MTEESPHRHMERVARFSDIREGRSLLVRVGGQEIALWKISGKIYAIHNVCPHQHFSSLHEGTLEGLSVTCPRHGWTFSLEDGRAQNGNGRAKLYSVEVVGDQVYLEIPAEGGN